MSKACLGTLCIQKVFNLHFAKLILLIALCQSLSFGKSFSFLPNIANDVINLHCNIFSRETVTTLAVFTPAFLLASSCDKDLHSCFYNKNLHKNINQLPRCCDFIAAKGIAVPIVACAGLALFSKDLKLKTTAYSFWIGLPCAWVVKKIAKLGKAKLWLRPASQNFEKNKKAHGAFPSGHMMVMAYMTTLFGIQMGASWGVPLGIFSSFVFTQMIICNRHYISQLIAGTALGVIYGLATSKLVDQKLDNLELEIIPDNSGLKMQCAYLF